MDFLFILWIFLISIGINYLFFALAFAFKTDAFTDITYTLSFSLLTIIILAWRQNFSLYQILIFVLINLWAIRLGSYLLVRIRKIKIDHRFDKMRNSLLKFGGFWTLQGISVFMIAAPGVFALSISQSQYFNHNNYVVILFAIIALIGLVVEAVADATKFRFYNNRTSKSVFLKHGIWKISRHPNYFGEILFWYAICVIFLFGFLINNAICQASNALQLLWFLSPIYIMLLINFVSGVPLLEVNAYKRYGSNPDYVSYVAVTACVVPWIGKRGNVQRVKAFIKKSHAKPLKRGVNNESNS